MKDLLEYKFLIPLVLILGFAPFYPQPHIVEKIRMLVAGTLKNQSISLIWSGTPGHSYCWHTGYSAMLAVV